MKRADAALFGASVVAVAIGALLAFLAARVYTRPLRLLTAAAHGMKRGELLQQVPVLSDDELGELTSAFNQMSADLARSQTARRRMTADIAHDLRTPLTVITGYLEAMCDGKLEVTSDRLETLRHEADQLHRLVSDLRTLSLADSGALELVRAPVSPRAFLLQAADAFAHRAADNGIQLSVEAAETLPAVGLDPERMTRAFSNLIANALRHTPRAGSVVLSARGDARAVDLSVADSGTGISPDDLPNVFERFYRADSSRQPAAAGGNDEGSTGLGLAIAKSIVEAHGGSLSVESELGRGTTFVVRLPR